MWRLALASFLSRPGRVAAADNVYRGVGAIGGAVFDGVGLPVQYGAAGLTLNIIVEQPEQRHHPEVPRLGGVIAVPLHRL